MAKDRAIKRVLVSLGILDRARLFRDRIVFACNYAAGNIYRPCRYAYSYIRFILKKTDNTKAGTKRRYISLLCPTRGRPGWAARFISSVYRTAVMPERIEVLFCVDSDDEDKDSYQSFLKGVKTRFSRLKRCELFIRERTIVSRLWDTLAQECSGDLLIIANDDQVYVDYGWDVRLDEETKKFPDEIFCMWFNDAQFCENLATFPIISRRWFKVLGYLSPGIFKFLNTDAWIHDIARRINRLHYIPDILVEHLHCDNRKAPFDKTYRIFHPGRYEIVYSEHQLFKKSSSIREEAAEKLKTAIDIYKAQTMPIA
ncbi:MAG: hypothetical protein ABH843_05515 [Candidatus Omnitrophota bacterium]